MFANLTFRPDGYVGDYSLDDLTDYQIATAMTSLLRDNGYEEAGYATQAELLKATE